jgi:hypothetical protein
MRLAERCFQFLVLGFEFVLPTRHSPSALFEAERPASRNSRFQLWIDCSDTPFLRPASAAVESPRNTASTMRTLSSVVFFDGLARGLSSFWTQTRT